MCYLICRALVAKALYAFVARTLSEYEHFAVHANLTDEMRCEEIRIYFSKKEKWVLDVLEGYQSGDWNMLKGELKSLYTSSVEQRTYQPHNLQRFIAKKQKISKLGHFDTYRCKLSGRV